MNTVITVSSETMTNLDRLYIIADLRTNDLSNTPVSVGILKNYLTNLAPPDPTQWMYSLKNSNAGVQTTILKDITKTLKDARGTKIMVPLPVLLQMVLTTNSDSTSFTNADRLLLINSLMIKDPVISPILKNTTYTTDQRISALLTAVHLSPKLLNQ